MRFVVLACLSLCPQERNEERGSFALYRGGRAVGREDWRIEEFGDGRSGVFARTKLAGKVETANDTVLTLDRDGRALLFAGIATTAGATLETRLEIKGGRALCEVKAAGAETGVYSTPPAPRRRGASGVARPRRRRAPRGGGNRPRPPDPQDAQPRRAR